MGTAQVQRRRTVRRAVRVVCQVVRLRDFKLVGESSADLSPDGMQLVASEGVLTGERVIASFQAPRTGAWVDVEGSVVRVSHGRRAGEGDCALGVSFDALEDGVREELAAALRGIPPALPRRRGGGQS